MTLEKDNPAPEPTSTVGSIEVDQRVESLWKTCSLGTWSLYVRHPLEIRLTKSKSGVPGIDFVFEHEPDIAPSSSNGFTCETVPEGNRHIVRIVRTTSGEPGLFEAFVLDLVELCHALHPEPFATTEPSPDCTPIVKRIAAWQDFMHRRPNGLTEKAEIGLFGELSILLDWLRAGGNPQLVSEVWTGPVHGARDFRFDADTALEVKTSRKLRPFAATIDSLEQLDTSDCPELFLAAVGIEEFEGTESTTDRDGEPETLRTLCEKISALLPTASLRNDFESLCLRAGFRCGERKQKLHAFVRRQVLCYRAESLPRMTRANAPGILRARYDILLSDENAEPLPDAECIDYHDFLELTLRNRTR